MEVIFDLHLHSRFSRATSKNLNIKSMKNMAKIKGLDVLGTGDFTHPNWMEELKAMEERDGLLYFEEFPFMLSVEVNNVFEYNSRILTIHNVILTNSIDSAIQISDVLSKYGDLNKDGRPTINLSIMEMMDKLKELNQDTEIFAAHIWTPWFSILGARNNLSSIFEVIDKRLLAVETGLSADPDMTLMTHAGDFPIISNSDAHSLENIAREATKVEVEKLTYKDIIKAIKNKKIIKTFEFYPQEGKYYYDGHRNCNIFLHPKDSEQNLNICPKCGKKLTIGVLHRVYKLKDNIARDKQNFQYIIPIKQILSYIFSKPITSVYVNRAYAKILNHYKTELNVFERATNSKLVELLGAEGEKLYRAIKGEVEWRPGYDGVYGEFKIKDNNILKQL